MTETQMATFYTYRSDGKSTVDFPSHIRGSLRACARGSSIEWKKPSMVVCFVDRLMGSRLMHSIYTCGCRDVFMYTLLLSADKSNNQKCREYIIIENKHFHSHPRPLTLVLHYGNLLIKLTTGTLEMKG